MITQTELKDKLNYDHSTGVFTWAKSQSNRVKNGNSAGYNHHGYIQVRIGDTKYYTHRLAWLWVYGYIPEKEIDHIDGNRSNNNIDNLREVTSQENSRNRSKSNINKSGHVGVIWNKNASKWQSYIKVCGEQIYLGVFQDKNDAIVARKIAEREYGFHQNHGRKKEG